jgi:hypothetical protein
VKSLFRFAAVPAAAIALAAAVAALRHVPATPGVTVQTFLAHLSRGRNEKAAELLSPRMRAAATPAALARWQAQALRGLGEAHAVRGETEWISGSEAEATGVIEAGRRDRRLRFGLERDSGRWVLSRLDDFWLAEARPSESIRIRELGRRRTASPRRR